MRADVINGMFELAGALLSSLNVRKIYVDKRVVLAGMNTVYLVMLLYYDYDRRKG